MRRAATLGFSWDRHDTVLAAGLLTLFVASRLLWLWAYPESSQYWEEGYRWLAAEEIAAGGSLPWLDYQADHYQGGSLVVIGLTVALMALGFGSFAALKSVALFFSGATLLGLYGVGRVFLGRRAGLMAAALYLLGPPLVAFWGMVAMGFHSESVLLSLAVIGAFLALATGTWRGPGAWLGFGVVSSLSVWFCPTAGIAVLACALTWPLVAERPGARDLLAGVAGLGVGLVPWWIYNLTHGFAGLTRIFEVFGLRPSADPWRTQNLFERAAELLLRVPSQGLLDPGGDTGAAWWMGLLVAGVWIPAGLALWHAVQRATAAVRDEAGAESPDGCELVFVVYALLFAGVYLLSRFTLDRDPSPIGYRLLVPPAVLVLPLIGASAARALATRQGRAACAAGFACLGISTLSFARTHQEPFTPLALEGADLTWGRLLHGKHAGDLEAAIEVTRRFPAERREQLLVGIGWGIEATYERVGAPSDVVEQLKRLDRADRAQVQRGVYFWVGMTRQKLATSLQKSEDPDLQRVLTRLNELAAHMAPAVVLITLDTTRVDHLSCYGYERETTPNLDALAERSVRFRRAWSTSTWTLPAHASLFTGMYPLRHGARYDSSGGVALGDRLKVEGADQVRAGMLVDDATTLAEMMGERGFRTAAIVAGPWLHRDFGLLQGFQHQDDEVTSFNGRPAAEITSAAVSWLDDLHSTDPYFLFVNYFDPHAPYKQQDRYPDLPRAAEPLDLHYDEMMRGTYRFSADERAILRDRYDGEIRDMDRELGRLLEAVFARANGSQAMIVVTADHGEALAEDGRLGHGFWLTEELTRVPLIVRYPHDRDGGQWRDEPIQLVDVLPLIADEFSMPLSDAVEGVKPGERTAAFAEIYRESSTIERFGDAYDRDLRSVIRWPDKLVRNDRGEMTLSQLSDGSVREQPPSATDAAALAAELDAHVASRPEAPLVAPQPSPEAVEALRQLGYVE
jgi:arylsulfatase